MQEIIRRVHSKELVKEYGSDYRYYFWRIVGTSRTSQIFMTSEQAQEAIVSGKVEFKDF